MLATGGAPVEPKGDIIPWLGKWREEGRAESDAGVEVDGVRVDDAVRYYPGPKEATGNTRSHVAFHGTWVEVAG